jgi:hypothetical protein
MIGIEHRNSFLKIVHILLPKILSPFQKLKNLLEN